MNTPQFIYSYVNHIQYYLNLNKKYPNSNIYNENVKIIKSSMNAHEFYCKRKCFHIELINKNE